MEFLLSSLDSTPISANSPPEINEPFTPLTPDSSSGSLDNFKESHINTTSSISGSLTQGLVEGDPSLKRLQQDLLILTGFPDNSTLHWRPCWFAQDSHASKTWTLQNPPDVVTEALPGEGIGTSVWTRRMRTDTDSAPLYIKDWDSWFRYCEMYGIPRDFLNAKMMALMRLGLPKSDDGKINNAPNWPLYPEPQPLSQGRYLLDRASYRSLPGKFHMIEPGKIIVVHSTGALDVVEAEPFYFHSSQWTHFNGYGMYIDNFWYDADPDKPPKTQHKGRHWSWLPWTKEQEESCSNFKLQSNFVTEEAEKVYEEKVQEERKNSILSRKQGYKKEHESSTPAKKMRASTKVKAKKK